VTAVGFFIFIAKEKNMTEPSKLFSVQMPYSIFEQVKAVAKNEDLSVNKVIRIAIGSFLKGYKSTGLPQK